MTCDEIVGLRIYKSSDLSASREIVSDEFVDVMCARSGAQQLRASRVWKVLPERKLLHVKNILNDVLLKGS